jgi:uncharacterized phage infection (PIP) family protein YhgE
VATPTRANVGNMKSSGYTSAGRNNRNKEELDQESQEGLSRINQKDAEIDRGINEISQGLDQLADIANMMKEEVCDISPLLLPHCHSPLSLLLRHKIKTANLSRSM